MHSEPGETCTAQYFDGQSAIAHDVVVRCGTIDLKITAGEDVLAIWPYPDLLSPDPLTPRREARLTHASAPYARLVVDDPAFAERILYHAPHLSSKAHRKRAAGVVGVCMLIALAFVAFGYLFLTFAPRTVAGVMPDKWRNNLGAQVEQLLVGNRKVCTAPEGIAALEVMTKRLTDQTPDPGQFKVLVYDLAIINAFALPGGTIVISRKLIESAESAEGVAGVLAHEMGHVTERDSEAQLVRSLGISVLQQVLFGGSSGVGEAIGGVAGLLALVSYTREAEWRADGHARTFLENAAVDPAGLISFFQFVKDKHASASEDDSQGGLGSLFRTHPGLTERIDVLRDAPKWKSRPVLTEQQWSALKSICETEKTDK